MRPSRELFRQADQTYFASFQTARRQCFFRNERWSTLFLNTLDHYLPQLGLHDFVIMPDHIHLLLSPPAALEKSIQLIKGGFSFRAKRELQWNSDIWQVGFTDHRIRDIEDLDIHLQYLMKNERSGRSEGSAIRGTETHLSLHPFPQWLKPPSPSACNGGAEAPPLQSLPPDKPEAPPLQSLPPDKVVSLPLQSRRSDKVEAPPFQSLPTDKVVRQPFQGLPPDEAERQLLQSRNPRLEDFYRQHSPSSPEGRADIHTAKDAADLFRKLGI